MRCRIIRLFVPGGTYFFTLVTAGRRRFLTDDASRSILRAAIEEEKAVRPFEIIAWVLLPDHLHTIWQLPPGDAEYSLRIARIKQRFTREYLTAGGTEASKQPQRARGERSV